MVHTLNFEKLLNDYREAHPDAQNPLDYSIALGGEGILAALKKSKGRKIVFVEDLDAGDDVVAYHFE